MDGTTGQASMEGAKDQEPKERLVDGNWRARDPALLVKRVRLR